MTQFTATPRLTHSRLTHLAAVLAAGVALIATAPLASANNSHQNHGSMNSGMNSGHSMKNSNKDKSADKTDKKDKSASHKKKHKKDKTTSTKKDCKYVTADGKRCGGTTTQTGGNKPGTDTQKDKAPVIVNGGFILDKLPNGTSYYRRPTKAEFDQASKVGTVSTGN